MVALTEEVKKAFSTLKAFPIATSSKAGIPNVVPIGFVELVDDETIWIADNFMKKILANVLENPQSFSLHLGTWNKGMFPDKG
jgi:uncharacterized protein